MPSSSEPTRHASGRDDTEQQRSNREQRVFRPAALARRGLVPGSSAALPPQRTWRLLALWGLAVGLFALGLALLARDVDLEDLLRTGALRL